MRAALEKPVLAWSVDRMTAGDAAEVAAFFARFPEVAFCDWEDEGLLAKVLSREGDASYLARRQDGARRGEVVGAVLAGSIGVRGSVNHIAVDPEFRFDGVGRVLVERALESLRADGIRRVFLFVAETSVAAGPFWNSMGFSPVPGEIALERDLD